MKTIPTITMKAKAYLFAAPLGIPAFVKNVVHFVTRTVIIYTILKPLENKNLQMIVSDDPPLTSNDRSYLVNSFSTDHRSNQVESMNSIRQRDGDRREINNPGNHGKEILKGYVVYATFRCKGSGKRGHIVADTTFVSGTPKKNYSDFVQKHFVSAINGQPKKHHEQQNVSATMCPFCGAKTCLLSFMRKLI